MSTNPTEPTDMTLARAAKLVRDHAANTSFSLQAMQAEAAALQGMVSNPPTVAQRLGVTPEHADPECSSDEIAAILRVQAARIARQGGGWPMIATDLVLAADRLESQEVQLDVARLTVQELLDTIADLRSRVNALDYRLHEKDEEEAMPGNEDLGDDE